MTIKKLDQIIAESGAGIKGEITAEAKAGVALITIRGRVGVENATSDAIAQMVSDLIAQDIKKAKVFISSPGGSVFQMNDIIAELEKFEEVELEIGAVCASCATMPLTRFKATARPNSQFMIHKPMLPAGGNEDEVESALKHLKDVTATYRTAYAQKMGKTEDEVEAMWKQDKWMTAKEALALGLISAITGSEIQITAELSEELVACGAPNTQITTTKKPTMDKEQLIASLGLDADATDEQINAAIKAMKEKADKQDKAEKDTEKDLKAKAEKEVMAAIGAKKITADMKDHYVDAYMKAPEATGAILDKLPELEKVSDQLNRKKFAETEALRKDWTLDDYLEKDPEAYEKLRIEDPAKAERLENEYFKSNN